MNKFLKYSLVTLLACLSVAATVKISDMVAATTVGNADIFTIVQGGVNKKVTQATLLTNTFANVTAGSGINVTNQGTNIIVAATATSGKLVNYTIIQTSATDSTTTQIPVDGSTPQSGEGKEFATWNYTPTAGNTVLVRITGQCATSNASGSMTTAIFMDSDANALSNQLRSTAVNVLVGFQVIAVHTGASGSQITFKLRFGISAAAGTYTAYINRNSATYSSTDFVTIEIFEYLP